jgi:hypothetical protein
MTATVGDDGAPRRFARSRDVDVPVVVAAVLVVALVALVVVFSLRGTGDEENAAPERACRAEVTRVRDAVAAYRARHPSETMPTAAQLVSDGRLVVAPLRYAVEYEGSPPALRLRPLPGSGC